MLSRVYGRPQGSNRILKTDPFDRIARGCERVERG
jgi:hypothetical protein